MVQGAQHIARGLLSWGEGAGQGLRTGIPSTTRHQLLLVLALGQYQGLAPRPFFERRDGALRSRVVAEAQYHELVRIPDAQRNPMPRTAENAEAPAPARDWRGTFRPVPQRIAST